MYVRKTVQPERRNYHSILRYQAPKYVQVKVLQRRPCQDVVRCLRACITFLQNFQGSCLGLNVIHAASWGLQVSNSFLKALLLAAFCAALIFSYLLSCSCHPLLLFGCSLVGMPTVICWRMLGRVGHTSNVPILGSEQTWHYFDYCVWKGRRAVSETEDAE